MKSDVETLNPTRVRLTVEVPFEEFKPSLDQAYARIASSVAIPGFRKGKVPPRLIDQRFGPGVALEEAVNEALPRFYGRAVEAHEVQVIGQPEVDVTEVPAPGTEGELRFTAEVDVRPQVAVPDLENLEVTVDDADVAEDEIEEQLTNLRERFGTLRGVDRPAQDGDFVSIDLSAGVDGEPLEDATSKGLSYQVGSGGVVEGLDEALIGMSAEETRTFPTTLVGGDHAGREAEVSVTLASVKERDLPALDDEFAQTASEFDTLEELRADLRTRLERMKRMQQGVQARDKVLEELLGRVDVPLPESIVKAEVEGRMHNLAHQLEEAGLTKADYLREEGQTEQEFDAEVETRSRDAIKAQLVLDAVATDSGLGVEQDELTEHIIRSAVRRGVTPEEFAQQVVQAGQVPVLVSEVVRGKALASVLEKAKVTDASGRPVDLDALVDPLDGELDPGDDLDGELDPGDDLDGADDLDDDVAAAEPVTEPEATSTPQPLQAAQAGSGAPDPS